MDLLRKYNFDPLNFSSKFMITCTNPILVHFLILRISDFDLDSYFEYGPKSEIRTIEKWTKIEFEHVIINFDHFSGPKKGPCVSIFSISNPGRNKY